MQNDFGPPAIVMGPQFWFEIALWLSLYVAVVVGLTWLLRLFLRNRL